jgi:hypothetical protein
MKSERDGINPAVKPSGTGCVRPSSADALENVEPDFPPQGKIQLPVQGDGGVIAAQHVQKGPFAASENSA